MRYLVCGGRDYSDDKELFEVLAEITEGDTDPHFIVGGARGADTLAEAFARARGIPFTLFRADWDRQGKKAGYLRNTQMLVEGKPDVVVAFPGGKGTEMMMNIARKANVRVIEIGSNA